MAKYKTWKEEERQYISSHPKSSDANIAEMLGRTKSSVQHQRIRLRLLRHKLTRVYTANRYWTQSEEEYLSQSFLSEGNIQLAKELHKTPDAIQRKLNYMNLQRPDTLARKLAITPFRINTNSRVAKRLLTEGITKPFPAGESNPMWNGGSSFEPYDPRFNMRFKSAVLCRDGHCLMCNISIDDLHLLKRRVCVHHVDYNKQNSLPQNCVTLCGKCHPITNTNRKQWIPFFQSLLKDRYGYQYNAGNQIVIDLEKPIKNNGGEEDDE